MRRLHRATFPAFWVLVASILLVPCFTYAVQVLEPRDTNNASLPSPITFAPNQNWEGIDGQWNTFSLRVGEPAQWLRVLISTASQQTWTIYDSACSNDTTCFDSRGRTFNDTASKTWNRLGFYQLWLEQNIDYAGNGLFGYDTVGLGLTEEDGPTLLNTTVGTYVSDDFWFGHFGLNAKPTNFTAFSEPSPSYMTYLFQQNLIPGLSFGYTAGAQYHLAIVLASLTLGGYDASRFIPNNVTFTFAPDNERDIVVDIVGIQANGATDVNINLLKQESFDMYIDSTVSELWLPTEVCDAFEETFGLQFNNDTELYLVDDDVHSNLLARNASITFSLGQKATTSDTVNITLPYASFDLEATPPYRNLGNTTRYFPIRRANETNQFILGRTFLQEAYLIVDWERQNFSVSQCNFVYGQNADIVPIISPQYTGELATPPPGPKHLSTGAIIGIAIGSGFSFALVVCGIVGWFWRKRHHQKLAKMKAEIESKVTAAAKVEPPRETPEETPTSPITDPEEGSNVFPKVELPAEPPNRRLELSTDVKDGNDATAFELPSPAVEVENTERQIYEMPGDIPVRQEADGRQLSEKESMMFRERMYNGIDANETPNVSSMAEEHPKRPPPILPSEVQLVSRRLPVSPVTPVTSVTSREGLHLEASDTFFQPSTRTPRDGRFLEGEDTLLSPISPLDRSAETSRRRFSYES